MSEVKCEICGSQIDVSGSQIDVSGSLISTTWCGDNKYAYHTRCIEQKYYREWKKK